MARRKKATKPEGATVRYKARNHGAHVVIRQSEAEHAALKKAAKAAGMSMSDFTRAALDQYAPGVVS